MSESPKSPVTVGLKCFVCKENDTTVKKFNERTLQKCQLSLRSHIQFQLRYCTTHVPTTVNQEIGYHSQCYSNFNALNEKYRIGLETGPPETGPDPVNVPEGSPDIRYVFDHYHSKCQCFSFEDPEVLISLSCTLPISFLNLAFWNRLDLRSVAPPFRNFAPYRNSHKMRKIGCDSVF